MDNQDQGAFSPPEMENRAPLEARLPSSTALVGTDDKGGDKAKQAPAQAKPTRRVLRDDERLRVIGSPRVIVDRLPWETRVWVDRPVWGLPDPNMTFLGKGSRSSERYADELFGQLCEMALAAERYRLVKKGGNKAMRQIARMLDERERGKRS